MLLWILNSALEEKKNDINWLGLIDNILQANVALNYGMKQGKD